MTPPADVIGHYARSLHPGHAKRYRHAEELANEVINSVRDGEGDSFRKHYREMDVQLVDDIQFLADKESTPEEFFRTFNMLASCLTAAGVWPKVIA